MHLVALIASIEGSALPLQIWDQYKLPPGRDIDIPIAPTHDEELLRQFWEARTDPKLYTPLIDQVNESVENRLILDTANLPGRLKEFGDMIAANYFELEQDGDFFNSAADILGCLSTKTQSEPAQLVLIKTLITLLRGGGGGSSFFGGARNSMHLETLHQLMKLPDMVRTNGIELLPGPELVKATVAVDKLYLECLNAFLKKVETEGTIRHTIIDNH